jgi:SAM-dependent methyltransferase
VTVSLGYWPSRNKNQLQVNVSHINREAWDRLARAGDEWTLPVSAERVEAARNGDWSIVLTPQKPVPRHWLGCLGGQRVLGLASGGGQQGPILAAAGARVTIIDNSPEQLARDRALAERHGLDLVVELGLMQDLSRFPDKRFDLVFNPVSNCFVEDLQPVWREAFRVLRPGGRLLTGFCNPVLFAFDPDIEEPETQRLKYPLPFSDLASRSPDDLARHRASGKPLEFSHSLETQIGGQLRAGFRLLDLYEDTSPDYGLGGWFPMFIATLAERPA